MIRRGAPAARPADGGRAFSWAALASDSDSDSVASAARSPPPKGKKVLVAPGAPTKASKKKTRVEELMDAAAFPDAPLYGPLDDGSVLVKEVGITKGGARVMDVCCRLPPLPVVYSPADTEGQYDAMGRLMLPPLPAVASTAELEILSAIMARGGLIDGDPEMEALDAPGACWGDLFAGPVVADTPTEPTEERPLRGTPEEFWAQPFAANLEVYTMDVYDTRALTDEEWNAMMSWLYWKGWWVDDIGRESVCAEPDDLPARHWCPPRAGTPEPEPEPECAGGPCRRWAADEPAAAAAEPKAPKKKALRAAFPSADGKAPVPVMRFCRAGAACPEKETGCRYVHGDTIPKVDKPCGFGAECGASDPTGVKRSQCLYMHPGEVWSADLCIHRAP